MTFAIQSRSSDTAFFESFGLCLGSSVFLDVVSITDVEASAFRMSDLNVCLSFLTKDIEITIRLVDSPSPLQDPFCIHLPQ